MPRKTRAQFLKMIEQMAQRIQNEAVDVRESIEELHDEIQDIETSYKEDIPKKRKEIKMLQTQDERFLTLLGKMLIVYRNHHTVNGSTDLPKEIVDFKFEDMCLFMKFIELHEKALSIKGLHIKEMCSLTIGRYFELQRENGITVEESLDVEEPEEKEKEEKASESEEA